MKNIYIFIVIIILIFILICSLMSKNDTNNTGRRVKFSRNNKIYIIPNREDIKNEKSPLWLKSEIFNGDVEGYQRSDMDKRGPETQDWSSCRCQYEDIGRGGYCAWQKDDNINPWVQPSKFECPISACGIDCNTGADLIDNNSCNTLLNYPCFFKIDNNKLLNNKLKLRDLEGAPEYMNSSNVEFN